VLNLVIELIQDMMWKIIVFCDICMVFHSLFFFSCVSRTSCNLFIRYLKAAILCSMG
jgi:hypothetical protein